jgi:hypothetical protein
MIKQIIGGVVTLAIGGTVYTVSQTNVVDNFSKNTGMSHKQAQNYVNSAQNNLESFSKIGQGLVSDGNSLLSTASQLDCTDYTYPWVTSGLSCDEGQAEVQTVGNDEIQLGNCYASLDTNLGNASHSQINECISDIDTTDSAYDLPIVTKFMSSGQITDIQNSNIYNKSVLQSALESN